MITNLLDDTKLIKLMALLKNANNVAICGHVGPDGDAMGACLGWADYMRQLDKNVTVCMPTPCPDFLKWMPGQQNVLYYNEKPKDVEKVFVEADLVCCIDFAESKRLQNMENAVLASKAKRLVIDHHTNPDEAFATGLLISRPEASSSSEMVFRLLLQLGGVAKLSRAASACIYCGIMTDTGNLSWSADDPELYQIISMLMRKHINKTDIYNHVYHSFSEHRLRFMGYLLNEKLTMYAGNKVALITTTREEMERYNFVRGDAEGIVNLPFQIKGCMLSISLREDTEKDAIRVSLRSEGDFPCNEMAAEYFNGGGHVNASGGELPFPMEEAVKTVERAIDKIINNKQ